MGTAPAAPSWKVPPVTRVRYLVLAWLCLAATIAYVHRNCISVAEEDIRLDLGLTKEEMGAVMSAFFLTYALCQLPAGWLGHVWGTRLALAVFALLWSVTTGLGALAGGVGALLLTRLGMGAAQAGIFSCSTSSIAQWFPGTRRAVASGALASFMSVGGAVGALLTGVLLDQMSWRWLFFLYALPGVVWAAWFFLWFRDRPQDHRAVSAGELALIRPSAPDPVQGKQDEPLESTPWGLIFTSPAMGWICGQQFFRAAGYIFFTSWFATFLKETRGVTTQQAGILNSLPLWGVVLGSLAGGALSDWMLVRTGSRRLSRQGLAVLSQVACALFILLAYPIANAWLAVLVISAGSFCAAAAGPCAYTVTIDMGGKHIPTVFSMMNMSGNLGAMVFPLVVPWLVRLTGNWDLVLFVFAGVYLAAAVCWLPINPNRTVFDRSRPSS